MKSLLPLLSLVVLASGCNSFSHMSERTEIESLETSPLTQVVLSTYNGAVTVEAHDSPLVEIETTYKAYGKSEAEATGNCEALGTVLSAVDGVLKLTATKPSGQWNASASYKILMPRDCKLDIKSSNGTIAVSNLRGDVSVMTSNGGVNVKEVVGAVTIESSNGRLVVKDILGPVDLTTSNGQIDFAGTLVGDTNSLRSSNGRIIANVNIDSVVAVKATTSNGSISCVADDYQEQPGSSKRKRSYMIGKSGEVEPAVLQIRTSNGSIALGDYHAKELGDSPTQQTPKSGEVDATDFDTDTSETSESEKVEISI